MTFPNNLRGSTVYSDRYLCVEFVIQEFKGLGGVYWYNAYAKLPEHQYNESLALNEGATCVDSKDCVVGLDSGYSFLNTPGERFSHVLYGIKRLINKLSVNP